MNNKLIDLNNFLFAQLERLDNEELSGDELKAEIQRSKAIKEVGATIVENARLALEAEQYMQEYGRLEPARLPEMLEHKK